MQPSQLLIPLASALLLSILGMPWLALVRRSDLRPMTTLRSRWTLFAWLHPFWAAVLHWLVVLMMAVTLAYTCWLWIDRSGGWAMAADAVTVAFQRLRGAGR